MMISTKGAYALRIMIDLSQRTGESTVSLKSIAERQKLSIKYLEQIASLLSRSGFIESRRGKSGGYSLTKSPEEYDVASILKLTEGNFAPISCVNDCSCERSDNCLSLPMWLELEKKIYDYLKKVTVKDIIDGNVER